MMARAFVEPTQTNGRGPVVFAKKLVVCLSQKKMPLLLIGCFSYTLRCPKNAGGESKLTKKKEWHKWVFEPKRTMIFSLAIDFIKNTGDTIQFWLHLIRCHFNMFFLEKLYIIRHDLELNLFVLFCTLFLPKKNTQNCATASNIFFQFGSFKFKE